MLGAECSCHVLFLLSDFSFRLDAKFSFKLEMAKVSLRVRYDGGQGVVKGLDYEDSVEKLISHSLEVLGILEQEEAAIKMLSGVY